MYDEYNLALWWTWPKYWYSGSVLKQMLGTRYGLTLYMRNVHGVPRVFTRSD